MTDKEVKKEEKDAAASKKTTTKSKRSTSSKTSKTKTTKAKSKTMGRPRKVDPRELAKGVDEYIATHELPIVAEYAHINGITREHLYHLAESEKAQGREDLYHAIKKLSEAKEIVLEKGGLTGVFQSSMAIFSLKQLGWRDKQEQEVTVGVDDDNASGVVLLAPVLERKEIEDE